jgi:cyclic pyranopterin phosphate synthase
MGDPLTHFDASGRAAMVDVSAKPVTARVATAAGRVMMAPETFCRVRDGTLGKGDVLAVARLAGIMAAKRTGELIPLCHPIGLDQVTVDLALGADGASVEVTATCRTSGRTGVEMEAMTAVTVACLTVYDMCKAMDRGMRVTEVRLIRKSGGRSGDWMAPA